MTDEMLDALLADCEKFLPDPLCHSLAKLVDATKYYRDSSAAWSERERLLIDQLYALESKKT